MTASSANQTTARELEVNVLVLGGGGTGLAAAISAADQGAKVLVAEKTNRLGGTTALSIGSITACCTSYQRRQGITDSPEAFCEDLAKFNKELDIYENPELRWVLAQESGNTVEWLRGFGFEFFGPSLEPPHRVARMHNIIPNSWCYPLLLQRVAVKKGVQLLLGAAARTLLQEHGRITGAVLDNSETHSEVKVHASSAVILACGDFSGSRVLKERYLAPALALVSPYNPNSQGEGHIMGAEVGGRLTNMEVLRKPSVRFIAAPKKLWHELLPSHPAFIKAYAKASDWLPSSVFKRLASQLLTTRGAPGIGIYREGAILVNIQGVRFTKETEEAGVAISQQPGGRAYIVFDSRVAEKFSHWPHYISTAPGIAYAYIQDYERDAPDILSKGSTVIEAARTHPTPDNLLKTVEGYNRFVKLGRDEDFGRSPLGAGLQKPPFYVMGPAESYLSVTKGGLDINTRFQVLNESGNAIPGLYAGGGNAGGLLFMSHGLGISWALTSGRLAGKEAARSI
jgi:succinate dehydrogenase/fumarate reductase flavoprotein subunit